MTAPSDAPQRETESSGTLRVLIVDDEPLARRRLRALLSAHDDIAIVGDAEDVLGAVRAARALSPDVLLLDVRIPGGDGFDVARQLLARGAEGLEITPFIVFVTADPTAAVPAFDVEAVDFLLKPYDAARLARALDRARAAMERRERGAGGAGGGDSDAITGDTAELRGATGPKQRWRERFVVIQGRRRLLVPVSAVTRIEADDNYVVLHLTGARHLVRHSLRALERELDPALWVRVHRSVMVRRAGIREVVTRPDGDWEVHLADGTTVRVGTKYRNRLRALTAELRQRGRDARAAGDRSPTDCAATMGRAYSDESAAAEPRQPTTHPTNER